MKKLILITLIALFSVSAYSQSFNKDYLLLYSDTGYFANGKEMVLHLYGHLPTFNPSDSTVTFDYSEAYYLDGNLFQFLEKGQTAHVSETITIGQTTYTFWDLYDIIVSVNDNQWQIGSWQVFLQFIN